MRFLFTCLAALALAQPAWGFECTKASTPVEKAICAKPELIAVDEAMTIDYRRLSALLGEKERSALLTGQRAWLKQRNRLCADRTKEINADCLAAFTLERRKELASHLQGVEATPPLVPHYRNFTDDRLKIDISIAMPVVSAPDAKSAALFKRKMEDSIAYDKNLQELKEAAAVRDETRSYPAWYFYRVSYRSAMLSLKLISLDISFRWFLGGAHDRSQRMAIAYDPVAGTILKRSDLFSDEAALLASVTRACRADLARQNQEAGHRLLFEDADPDAEIADFANWLLTPDNLLIRFGEYTIAPYASGQIDCTVPQTLLGPFAKRKR